jgi:hypothetical protein
MFENFLIRPDSLRNEVRDGRTVGFTLAVRHANYRGCYLSLHNDYYIEADGTEYPTTTQTFEVKDEPPRTFDEIRTAVHEHWDYDDEAVLYIAAPGGLGPGEHKVRFQQSVLAAYSYQQAQFFKELDLQAQNREVGQNLGGADGIELVDEMSLRYPDPGEEFRRQWFEWMETYKFLGFTNVRVLSVHVPAGDRPTPHRL